MTSMILGGRYFQIFSIILALAASAPSFATSTNFDVWLSYAQSHDFWKTVQTVQDNVGDISGIQQSIRGKFGKPDLLYSYLDATYSYEHDYFESDLFSHFLIGTRAEALAGGEISNPISPVIRAYANTTGISSFGFRSKPNSEDFAEAKAFVGLGPEKRLHAQGAEFFSAIPVRSGILLLAGIEGTYLSTSSVGDDFYITSDLGLRGTYFHSTVSPPRYSEEKSRRFATLHYRIQNEWLKEIETYFSPTTRVGLLSIVSQNPYPFLSLPITWDYQQDLSLFPGLSSIGGTGGIVRFLRGPESLQYSFYAGFFGGRFGGGFDVQYKSFVLNGLTYGIRHQLSPTESKSRIWSLSLGLLL